MSGYNSCTFVGNLGRDPETRSTGTGKPVCNFSIGVNEKKDGEPLWVNIVCFDKLAETAQRFLSKGRMVLVTGRLQIRSYDDKKTGERRQSTEIVASNVVFLGGGKGGKQSAPVDDEPADKPTATDDDSGNIPF